MKFKRILPLTILIFYCCSLIGQNSKYRIGVGVKPYITSLRNPLYDSEPFNYISPSVSFDYMYSNSIMFSTGLEYERKGEQIYVTYTDSDGMPYGGTMSKMKIDYIQIPLIATLKTKGNIKFYGNFGCSLGILFSNKLDFEDSALEDITGKFSPIDFSLLLGIGIEIKLNEQLFLGIALRENLGITDISGSESEEFYYKTNSAGLLLNIIYNF